MKKSLHKILYIVLLLLVFIPASIASYLLFSSFSNDSETHYVYIDDDDSVDSVYTKLSAFANPRSMKVLQTLNRYGRYAGHIRTGRYVIADGDGTWKVYRKLKNGLQDPVKLTIPSVRTTDRLAAEVAKKMMIDSTELLRALSDEAVCRKLGFDTTTVICLFVPNTYEVFWNLSTDKFLERMKREYDLFWNEERKGLADRLKLIPTEVMTLASIIDEETANDAEKPMIAGMYYNRLMFRDEEYPEGMPLQADPTVKFALKQFQLKRIYNDMLHFKSPYNTYINTGLPPGPIRIASVAGIDAVLHMVKHDYLYMCAKEDFSGTHRFARTYQEHLANAVRYAAALNQRGIK